MASGRPIIAPGCLIPRHPFHDVYYDYVNQELDPQGMECSERGREGRKHYLSSGGYKTGSSSTEGSQPQDTYDGPVRKMSQQSIPEESRPSSHQLENLNVRTEETFHHLPFTSSGITVVRNSSVHGSNESTMMENQVFSSHEEIAELNSREIDRSEKGRKGRNHYLSSAGYGTGSSSKEGSQSQDAHDDMVRKMSQQSISEESNPNPEQGIPSSPNLKQVSSSSAQVEDVVVGAEQTFPKNENSLSFPVAALMDSAHANGYERSANHLEMDSSNSSSSSFMLGSSIHNIASKIPQPLRSLPKSEPGNSESLQTVNSYNIDNLKLPCGRNRSDEPEESLLIDMEISSHQYTKERLLATARCSDIECDFEACIEIRCLVKRIIEPDCNFQHLSRSDKDIVNCMYAHAVCCILARCHFFWCSKDPVLAKTEEEIFHMMKVKLSKSVDKFTPYCKEAPKFFKLSRSLSFDVMPQEGQNWIPLCKMENTRETVLVIPQTPAQKSGSQDYWIIKKCKAFKNGNQLQLFLRLKEIQSVALVHHLWMASFHKDLMVCTQFELSSLQNRLRESALTQLDTVVGVMMRLISVAKELHQKNIVYLHWSSANVLLSGTSSQVSVKLTNFTSSALLDIDKVNDFSKDIRETLPVHLMPPELLTDGTVCANSDTWGLACLLQEMMTGKPVWHQSRHINEDRIKEMIKKQVPEVPKCCPELLTTFRDCWKHKASERLTLDELEEKLMRAMEIKMSSFNKIVRIRNM